MLAKTAHERKQLNQDRIGRYERLVRQRASHAERMVMETVLNDKQCDVMRGVDVDGRQLVGILLGSAVKIVVKVPRTVARSTRTFLGGYAFAERHNLLPNRGLTR
jgi:hypothetical protein